LELGRGAEDDAKQMIPDEFQFERHLR
jgi:hypothetical protein